MTCDRPAQRDHPARRDHPRLAPAVLTLAACVLLGGCGADPEPDAAEIRAVSLPLPERTTLSVGADGHRTTSISRCSAGSRLPRT